jgi:hypothetical protein
MTGWLGVASPGHVRYRHLPGQSVTAKEIKSREDKMANEKRGKGWFCAAASAGLLAVFAANSYPASAQETGKQARITAVTTIDLKTAPELTAVPRPADLVINRPTIPMADYIAAKNAAAAKPGVSRQQPAAAPPANSVTLFTQVASTNESQTTGGNRLPPDGDIATSADWMVQVNNDVITMFNWNTNAFMQVKLNTFFSDNTRFLFDPRVIYDRYWDKFVVLVDTCNPCSSGSALSFIYLAASKTNDPTGAWLVSGSNFGNGSGDFADFPQLGMDMNSLILTFNDFVHDGSFDAKVGVLPKALVYNGNPHFITVYGGNACTVAPPFVLDNSGVDYLLSFCPGSSHVSIGSLRDTGLSTESFTLLDNTVAVTEFGLPPDAQQPASAGGYTLDTGDNRFENRSLQVGNRILNIATVVDGHFPAVAWYNFNVGASPHTLVASRFLFAAQNSYDWHPSLNANLPLFSNSLGDVFTTWMSTNPGAGTNVQLRAAGWFGDDAGVDLAGIPVFTSAIPLTNQTDANGIHRTGDYSYIALYPAAALGCPHGNEIGILEGETAGPSAGLWGTHVGIVKQC